MSIWTYHPHDICVDHKYAMYWLFGQHHSSVWHVFPSDFRGRVRFLFLKSTTKELVVLLIAVLVQLQRFQWIYFIFILLTYFFFRFYIFLIQKYGFRCSKTFFVGSEATNIKLKDLLSQLIKTNEMSHGIMMQHGKWDSISTSPQVSQYKVTF